MHHFLRRVVQLSLLLSAALSFTHAQESVPAPTDAGTKAEPKTVRVVVVPIQGAVDQPTHYVLRRGIKEATEQEFDVVLLDMHTPGGSLDATLQIIEALTKFSGRTITFINNEAISAGAFIAAATDDIYLRPGGVIGAAAPVTGVGQDIDTTMKQKVVSYLKARVRAISEGKGDYRGQVVSAMIDDDYELKIGDKVIKPKGELLSLTATEAAEMYGDPPQPLLAAGVSENVEDLLNKAYGQGNYEIRRLEVTWSESVAQVLVQWRGILLGLGLLALYIEFKTAGFGIFGIAGIVLLGLVFLSSYVAGLSGHEPILFFALGFILLMAEILFFPGIAVLAITGGFLMLGSLVWAMADLWPNEPIEVTGDVFVQPLLSLALGIAIAVVALLGLARFLPKGWIWDRLVLRSAVVGNSQSDIPRTLGSLPNDPMTGKKGIAVTGLFPSGQVEIDGRRFDARVAVGHLQNGTPVVVVGRAEFELLVEEAHA